MARIPNVFGHLASKIVQLYFNAGRRSAESDRRDEIRRPVRQAISMAAYIHEIAPYDDNLDAAFQRELGKLRATNPGGWGDRDGWGQSDRDGETGSTS